MSDGLWEIVRADELRVGDVIIKTQCARYALKVQHIEERKKLVYLDNAHPVSFNAKVLRRIPDADDPRVLMRVIENLMEYQAMTNTLTRPVEEWIEDARRELESEGKDGA